MSIKLFNRKRPYEIVVKCKSARFDTVKELENTIRKHINHRYNNEDEFTLTEILSMEV